MQWRHRKVHCVWPFWITYIYSFLVWQILVEEKLSARILTLNRPKQLNALLFQMISHLTYWILLMCFEFLHSLLYYTTTLWYQMPQLSYVFKYIYIYINEMWWQGAKLCLLYVMLFPCFKMDGLNNLLSIISEIWMISYFCFFVSFKYTCPFVTFFNINHDFTWGGFCHMQILLCCFLHFI